MSLHQPFQVIGYHSCDQEIGLRVLNGKDRLKPGNNTWDWLGVGIYFWEQNPERALQYAENSAGGRQFNKVRIKTPFVLGTIIDLGNCLNLVEPESLTILEEAYKGLVKVCQESGRKLPINDGPRRKLDCVPPFDTIRSAFQEGKEVYLPPLSRPNRISRYASLTPI